MFAGSACGLALGSVSNRKRLKCLFFKSRSRTNARGRSAGSLLAPANNHFHAAAVSRSFIVPMALILCTIGLTACGGGGGGNVGSISSTESGSSTGGVSSGDTSTRTPPVLPSSPILAGPDAISGIDLIPSGMVKRTNAWMQKRWVIAERSTNHATNMGNIACNSYVVWHKSCDRANRPGTHRTDASNIDTRTTGTTPFSEVLDNLSSQNLANYSWIRQQISNMSMVKIVNISDHYFHISHSLNSANHPWLTIHSTSNESNNDNWFDTLSDSQKKIINDAIAANNLIFVSTYSFNSNVYTRHSSSSSCRGVNSGCLWLPAVLSDGINWGTSGAAPQLSAALASVLAVMPSTSHQNLAKFAKNCAKKSGNGIEKLLTDSGGTGVADFNCMSNSLSALSSLPVGGSVDMSINGGNVNFETPESTVSFAPRSAWHFIGNNEKKQDRFHFRLLPNGENAAMVFATFRIKDFFASFGVGNYDNFFGYKQRHREVFGSEFALGNKTLFIRLADIRSKGDDLISHAEGKSFGVTTERSFQPMEQVALKLSANFDKFLGGTAKIPFGTIKINEGRWNRQAALSVEHTARKGTLLGFNTRVFFPEHETPQIQFGLSLRHVF